MQRLLASMQPVLAETPGPRHPVLEWPGGRQSRLGPAQQSRVPLAE
jgi:hypothetical protein